VIDSQNIFGSLSTINFPFTFYDTFRSVTELT